MITFEVASQLAAPSADSECRLAGYGHGDSEGYFVTYQDRSGNVVIGGTMGAIVDKVSGEVTPVTTSPADDSFERVMAMREQYGSWPYGVDIDDSDSSAGEEQIHAEDE